MWSTNRIYWDGVLRQYFVRSFILFLLVAVGSHILADMLLIKIQVCSLMCECSEYVCRRARVHCEMYPSRRLGIFECEITKSDAAFLRLRVGVEKFTNTVNWGEVDSKVGVDNQWGEEDNVLAYSI